jgi:hypothetical protein
MNRRTRALALAGAACMTAGIAGACSSSSSSSGPVTGTETFSGTLVMTPAQLSNNNFHPTIPIKATGLFADTGSIALSGGNGAGSSTIVLGKGDIKVHHAATPANPVPKQVGAASSCVYGVTEHVAYTVTGGTGSYANVTGGHGTATIVQRVDLPKVSGGCNASNSAVPTGGSVQFTAVGPITSSSSSGYTK